jgi:putative ABC transport system permease protein
MRIPVLSGVIDGVSAAIARLRSLRAGVRDSTAVDAEMSEEFRAHMALRADDLVRGGLSPEAAARQARIEFGSPDHYKDRGRTARGLRPFDDLRISWLDFKLGFRMLSRYPGLTLVGGLALAFAVWLGATTFQIVTQALHPTLPFANADRIVGLRLWHIPSAGVEEQASWDLHRWRPSLKSIQDLGAYRPSEATLITRDGHAELVRGVEISASAFRIAGVRPVLGRALRDEDEADGAPPVIVIGYDVWQARFGGRSDVIDQTVRIGDLHAAVVGVMPQGFGFPVNENAWLPFRVRVADYGPRQGPMLNLFGRLAPGVSMKAAQAELALLGERASADQPVTHEHIRPQVIPYTKSVFDFSGWQYAAGMSLNLPVILLIVLVCGNVALLMYARAATRETEIMVRTALGASRARVVVQLFAEALVLGGFAAVVGLAVAQASHRWMLSSLMDELLGPNNIPFWVSDRLSVATMLYAGGLTVLAAGIAGVWPALRVTDGLGARLKAATAGGGGQRFSGVWTAVIVAQIAITLLAPLVTWAIQGDASKITSKRVGVSEREFLTLRLELDQEGTAGGDSSREMARQRFITGYGDLERRLLAEPRVAGVAFADLLPRMYHPHRLIELDSGGGAPLKRPWPAYRISASAIGPTYLDVLRAPVLVGRAFNQAEFAKGLGAPTSFRRGTEGGTVLVNQSFVKLILGGRNPIGRRFRYVHWEGNTEQPDQTKSGWFEIVGVVPDMGMSHDTQIDTKVAGAYHPASISAVYPVRMAVRVTGDPATFGGRLRAVAAEADAAFRVEALMPMAQLNDVELKFLSFWFRLLAVITGVALTLSLAGIYSVMAFTVSRRTREIGVRIALGAEPRRVALAILSRPLKQVVAGVILGAALVALLIGTAASDHLTILMVARQSGKLVVYSLAMLGVCLLACVVPVRRALAVQPTEALRAEG